MEEDVMYESGSIVLCEPQDKVPCISYWRGNYFTVYFTNDVTCGMQENVYVVTLNNGSSFLETLTITHHFTLGDVVLFICDSRCQYLSYCRHTAFPYLFSVQK